MRPITTRRRAMAASVSMLLLLVLLHSIAAAAGGGFKKSASPPRLVERWWDASGNGNQQQRGRAVVAKRPSSSQPPPPAFQSVKRCVLQLNNGTRLALAGALAGGFSNLVLYPIDVAKTLRQAGPSSAAATLTSQARAYGFMSLWAGLTPAILGSMPSSALYFGVYEQVKRRLGNAVAQQQQRQQLQRGRNSKADRKKIGEAALDLKARRANILRRWGVHAVAAAAGNTASSLIFVPKEVLKQQLQTYRNRGGAGAAATLPHVLGQILRERGVLGLYSGYRATLLRNIPSAILRFALYEEFKLFIHGHEQAPEWLRAHNAHIVAGALAGAISSAVTTPLDVVKTRMAINACPAGGDVLSCLVSVAQREGVPGLYAGLGFRVLYSALFTAVGFSSFEASKALLGVQDPDPPLVVPAGGEKGTGKGRKGGRRL